MIIKNHFPVLEYITGRKGVFDPKSLLVSRSMQIAHKARARHMLRDAKQAFRKLMIMKTDIFPRFCFMTFFSGGFEKYIEKFVGETIGGCNLKLNFLTAG